MNYEYAKIQQGDYMISLVDDLGQVVGDVALAKDELHAKLIVRLLNDYKNKRFARLEQDEHEQPINSLGTLFRFMKQGE